MVRLTHVEFAVDPAVMGGVLCFAGTRIPVDVVVGMTRQGLSHEQVAAEFPGLTAALVEAAVETASPGHGCGCVEVDAATGLRADDLALLARTCCRGEWDHAERE